MNLQLATVGRALGDADHHVHEEGGNNAGEWIRTYLVNAGVAVAAPWCAAAIQYWSDRAAHALNVPNPLDDVKLEAYVQSYYDWAQANGKLVTPAQALHGDLVLYSFGKVRYDHIGILRQPLQGAFIRAIEGNTSPGVGENDAERQREGDGVYEKDRVATRQTTAFVRWAP